MQEISSKDVRQCEKYGYSWKIVCEDGRLSIPHIGKRIRVLNMNWAKEKPKTLPLKEFELLLSICAASLDIEAVEPTGPAQKKIQNSLLWYDDDFKEARNAFRKLSMLCNHVAAPLKVAAVDDDLDEV